MTLSKKTEVVPANDCPSLPQISPNQITIGNPTERRRWQNRERQKAWRLRRRAASHRVLKDSTEDVLWKGYGMLVITDHHAHLSSRDVTMASASSRTNAQDSYKHEASISEGGYKTRLYGQKYKLIPPVLPYATLAPNEPLPAVVFPLSADHCLITLVQYNVLRALLLNMSILSMLDNLPVACALSLQIPTFGVVTPDMIPLDLQPTSLQKCTAHPFWIDAIPFPKMRDNLIINLGNFDSYDFCYDLGQGLYEGFDDVKRRGCLVWGEPWSMLGWEISEGFLEKWGFLLEDCANVIEVTNRWRHIRGEDHLVLEL